MQQKLKIKITSDASKLIQDHSVGYMHFRRLVEEEQLAFCKHRFICSRSHKTQATVAMLVRV